MSSLYISFVQTMDNWIDSKQNTLPFYLQTICLLLKVINKNIPIDVYVYAPRLILFLYYSQQNVLCTLHLSALDDIHILKSILYGLQDVSTQNSTIYIRLLCLLMKVGNRNILQYIHLSRLILFLGYSLQNVLYTSHLAKWIKFL